MQTVYSSTVKLHIEHGSALADHNQCRCKDHELTILAQQQCHLLTVFWTVVDTGIALTCTIGLSQFSDRLFDFI